MERYKNKILKVCMFYLVGKISFEQASFFQLSHLTQVRKKKKKKRRIYYQSDSLRPYQAFITTV